MANLDNNGSGAPILHPFGECLRVHWGDDCHACAKRLCRQCKEKKK